jgi:hypothetical protein
MKGGPDVNAIAKELRDLYAKGGQSDVLLRAAIEIESLDRSVEFLQGELDRLKTRQRDAINDAYVVPASATHGPR